MELELYFSEATSDASETPSRSAGAEDFEYEKAVDDGYYFVGDGQNDDDSCFKTLLEFLKKLPLFAKQNGVHCLF